MRPSRIITTREEQAPATVPDLSWQPNFPDLNKETVQMIPSGASPAKAA